MSERWIAISPDGRVVKFLYDDNFRKLLKLGKAKAERASDVVLDEATQKWVIQWPDGSRSPFGYEKRSQAIAMEIMLLEAEMLEDE